MVIVLGRWNVSCAPVIFRKKVVIHLIALACLMEAAIQKYHLVVHAPVEQAQVVVDVMQILTLPVQRVVVVEVERVMVQEHVTVFLADQKTGTKAVPILTVTKTQTVNRGGYTHVIARRMNVCLLEVEGITVKVRVLNRVLRILNVKVNQE